MKEKTVRMSKEERQKQILEAALLVFIDKGYNGATTAEIAKAANISEVTLFRHFDSKKDIFKLSVEPIVLNTLEASIKASENLSKKAQLEYILYERIKIVSENFEVIKLILMESQINKDLDDVNFIETMSKLIKDNILAYGFEVSKKNFIMRLLMGSVLSFLYMPEVNDLEIKQFVKEFIDMLIEK